MSDRAEAVEALAADPGRSGLVLDFDGVLAPIVADPTTSALPDRVALGKSAFLLRGFARPWLNEILLAMADISRRSGFRHMVTPRGDTMSVAMTNCGQLGWVTDQRGYRYTQMDPQTGAAWPSSGQRAQYCCSPAVRWWVKPSPSTTSGLP